MPPKKDEKKAPKELDDPKVQAAIEATSKAMPPSGEPAIGKTPIEPEPEPEVVEAVEDSPDDKQVLFTEEEAVEGESLAEPEYGELENMLIICEQCGRSDLVLSGDKLPVQCVCGLEYDYENESVTTEIAVPKKMTLAVRKVPRKFHPR